MWERIWRLWHGWNEDVATFRPIVVTCNILFMKNWLMVIVATVLIATVFSLCLPILSLFTGVCFLLLSLFFHCCVYKKRVYYYMYSASLQPHCPFVERFAVELYQLPTSWFKVTFKLWTASTIYFPFPPSLSSSGAMSRRLWSAERVVSVPHSEYRQLQGRCKRTDL